MSNASEADAWFLSSYSLSQYTSPRTDYDGANYPNPYKGGKWKVLLIGSQECYLEIAGSEFFLMGNHLIEMLLPTYHLDTAGFKINITTLSSDLVKFRI